MHLLTDPLQFDFFTRALLAVVLVSVLCALVGAWVVLRGLSYIGDAMSHAVFPGIVGAFLMKGNLLVGALIAAVLTALGIGAIGRRSGLKQDSAIGIVFVGMFALGIVMLSRAPTFTTDLSNFLIGNPLGVTPADLWGALAVTVVVGGILTAGPTRCEAAARHGVPAIVTPGCLDMVNFGAPDTVPAKFAGRTFYQHNPQVTLMRTSPEECSELGRILAGKVNLSKIGRAHV